MTGTRMNTLKGASNIPTVKSFNSFKKDQKPFVALEFRGFDWELTCVPLMYRMISARKIHWSLVDSRTSVYSRTVLYMRRCSSRQARQIQITTFRQWSEHARMCLRVYNVMLVADWSECYVRYLFCLRLNTVKMYLFLVGFPVTHEYGLRSLWNQSFTPGA